VLEERGIRDTRLVIEDAPDVIAMDDSPAKAVRGEARLVDRADDASG
jgi:hypothetical protein